MALLFDRNTETVIDLDLENTYIISDETIKEASESFCSNLSDEDPEAQEHAMKHGDRLDYVLPQYARRTPMTVYPSQLQTGDLIIERLRFLEVEINDGASFTVPGTIRIENAFGVLYLDKELTVEILR